MEMPQARGRSLHGRLQGARRDGARLLPGYRRIAAVTVLQRIGFLAKEHSGRGAAGSGSG